MKNFQNFYLLLNLIKIAIAKNINKTPTTISAMLIIFVIGETVDVDTLETLLTVEVVLLFEVFEFEVFEFELEFDDIFEFEFREDELLFDELFPSVYEFWLEEFSVKFKSIP